MKHMILSLKMKGDVISDHFLMLRFQKDYLDTVGFRTYGERSRVLNQKHYPNLHFSFSYEFEL